MKIFDWFHTSSYERAKRCLNQHQFADAVQYYLKAIEDNDHVAVAAFDLSLCYRSLGLFPEAARAMSAATKANPANANAWEVLSLLQGILGMASEAEQSARIALSASIDQEQLFMSRMALVQALLCQLQLSGGHYHEPDSSLEACKRNGDRLGAQHTVIVKMAPELRELTKARPEFDQVWRLFALAGMYAISTGWMPVGMRRLKELKSPEFDTLRREFEVINGYRFNEAYLDDQPE